MQQDLATSARLAAAPATVWKALLDVQRVASWLSIAGSLHELEPLRRYSVVLEDRIGPFTLRADLLVTVDADEAQHKMRVTASGADRQVRSQISATIDLAVISDGQASVLDVNSRYEITGRIATLAAGAIRRKSQSVLQGFLRDLSRDLGAAG